MRERVLHERDLFGELDEATTAEVLGKLPSSDVPQGEVIFRPGETDETLFIVRSGRVAIYRLAEDGRKLVLETLDEGSAFGQLSLIGESMGGSFAEAAEDSTIVRMTAEDLDSLMQQYPRVAMSMVHLLSRRLQELEERLQDVAFRTVPARLAALLLRLADENNDVSGLSHQELAEMVGTSRETVSRALLDFKAAGLVDIGRRSVHIRNLDALREALTGKGA